MCGIVAYIGNQQAAPIIIKGLKRLEYRGYDSTGVSLFDGSELHTIKTKGKVVVGSTGIIEGDVHCQNADISGELLASIDVSELLSLKATAKINGDIVANKLSIEPGASFTGSCSMGAVIKDINHVGKQEKQEKTA